MQANLTAEGGGGSQGDSEGRVLSWAFFHQKNLILLGGALLFCLALATPWPVIAGVLGEVIWLGIATNSAYFRRLAGQDQATRVKLVNTRQRVAAAAGLDPQEGARAQALEEAGSEIRRLVAARGLQGGALDRPGRGLDDLLLAYLRMSGLHQQLGRALGGQGLLGQPDGERERAIEQELERLRAAVTEEKDPSLRLSLRQSLAIGQRRLKQHQQVDIQRRALGMKLSSLEMSFAHLRAQILGGVTAAELEAELDQLHANLGSLPEAEAEAHSALSRLTGPLTAIGPLSRAAGEG